MAMPSGPFSPETVKTVGVPPVGGTVRIVLSPKLVKNRFGGVDPAEFASKMAWRSDPAPESLLLVTVKTLRSVRSSSHSTDTARRAPLLRREGLCFFLE